MIFYRKAWINFVILIMLTILCLGFQGTFWFQITGGSPSPQLWLNIILYVILFRHPRQAFFLAYIIGWMAAAFSSAPLSLMWPSLLITVSAGIFLKSRFFWPNTRYFIAASFVITLLFQCSTTLISYLFERSTIPLFGFSRTIEILLTPLCAAPIYWVFAILDRWMEENIVPESVGAEE